MSTKAFELQISSQETSRFRTYFVTLFFNESINSKFTQVYKLKIFDFFLHNIVKRLKTFDKKSKFCQTLVEMFQFLANGKYAAIF